MLLYLLGTKTTAYRTLRSAFLIQRNVYTRLPRNAIPPEGGHAKTIGPITIFVRPHTCAPTLLVWQPCPDSHDQFPRRALYRFARLRSQPRCLISFWLWPASRGLFPHFDDPGECCGRDVFALSFALQLLWASASVAGAVADRFGMVRVMSIGALMYAAGLALMAYTTSPLTLQITAGVLVGFGLSGCSFNLVIAACGKLLDERYRMLAIGAGTAAGSFGQFLFARSALR